MLQEKMKDLALKHGEELVKDLIKEVVRPFAEEFIKNSENKIDDIMLPFLDQLEGALINFAEDIHTEPAV